MVTKVLKIFSDFRHHKCIVFVSKSSVNSVAVNVAVFIGSDHMAAWVAQHVADADRLTIALIHSNPPVDQYAL